MLLLVETMIKINQFLDFNVPSSACGHLIMRSWRRWSNDEVSDDDDNADDDDWWRCRHSRTQEAWGVAGSMLSKLPNRKCWMMGNLASTCNSEQFRVSTCSPCDTVNNSTWASVHPCETMNISMWTAVHPCETMNISMWTCVHPFEMMDISMWTAVRPCETMNNSMWTAVHPCETMNISMWTSVHPCETNNSANICWLVWYMSMCCMTDVTSKCCTLLTGVQIWTMTDVMCKCLVYVNSVNIWLTWHVNTVNIWLVCLWYIYICEQCEPLTDHVTLTGKIKESTGWHKPCLTAVSSTEYRIFIVYE